MAENICSLSLIDISDILKSKLLPLRMPPQLLRTLTKIFATHGIPEIIVTDNRPPFHRYQFKNYMQQIGTFHQLSTSYWPQGNAEVERFMRTRGKMLVKSKLESEDLQEALSRLLF